MLLKPSLDLSKCQVIKTIPLTLSLSCKAQLKHHRFKQGDKGSWCPAAATIVKIGCVLK